MTTTDHARKTPPHYPPAERRGLFASCEHALPIIPAYEAGIMAGNHREPVGLLWMGTHWDYGLIDQVRRLERDLFSTTWAASVLPYPGWRPTT